MTKAQPLLETYRATVAPEDCDHLGHMNVQHYFRAVSDGMFSLMAQAVWVQRRFAPGRCPLRWSTPTERRIAVELPADIREHLEALRSPSEV